jgi:hypothetical protein
MKASNTFLRFVDKEGNKTLVSISDILDAGCPIDPETGDDLDLDCDCLFDKNGEKA